VNGTTYKGTTIPALPNIEVTNALLTLTVDNKSRAYGSDNPVWTGGAYAFLSDGTTKYLNKDGITMAFANYTTNTTPVGNDYPIYYTNYSDPNFKAANYKVDTSSGGIGKLSITGAPLLAVPRSFVMRTGQAVPTYTTTNVSGYVNGESSTVITTWPTWSSGYTPSAALGSFFRITNVTAGVAVNYTFVYSTNGTVTVSNNVPPTAANDAITITQSKTQGSVAKIVIAKLLANDKSVFGDKLTLSAYDKTSRKGIAIGDDGTANKQWLYYNTGALLLDTNNADMDTFTYTVKDAVGGTAKATVQVKVVIQNVDYVPKTAFEYSNEANGWLTIKFLGIGGRKYKVLGTDTLPSLVNPWPDLYLYDRNVFSNINDVNIYRTNVFTCDTNGVIYVTDPDSLSYPTRFYKTSVQ
jgi:hypothetical protein